MNWILGEKHPEYGTVVATLKGEVYRWLDKKGVISMIPLSVLVKEKD